MVEPIGGPRNITMEQVDTADDDHNGKFTVGGLVSLAVTSNIDHPHRANSAGNGDGKLNILETKEIVQSAKNKREEVLQHIRSDSKLYNFSDVHVLDELILSSNYYLDAQIADLAETELLSKTEVAEALNDYMSSGQPSDELMMAIEASSPTAEKNAVLDLKNVNRSLKYASIKEILDGNLHPESTKTALELEIEQAEIDSLNYIFPEIIDDPRGSQDNSKSNPNKNDVERELIKKDM